LVNRPEGHPYSSSELKKLRSVSAEPATVQQAANAASRVYRLFDVLAQDVTGLGTPGRVPATAENQP